MSEQEEPATSPPAKPPPTLSMQNTPNAERYVLEADAMRRRQMRSALLHGSRKTWREHQRVWPAVVVGLIVVGVIIAGIAVMDAFRVTQENQREQQREQEQSSAAATADGALPAACSLSLAEVNPGARLSVFASVQRGGSDGEDPFGRCAGLAPALDS